MSKDKIEVNMNVYDIPILVEALEKANKEIERLKKREQECIDHYLVQRKYASEMEDKYITANNIINDIDRYIHNWKLEDIGEKTMLILNDILLIKNGMSDKVIRLKGSDKE